MKCEGEGRNGKGCAGVVTHGYKMDKWPRMHYCEKHAAKLIWSRKLTRLK